MINQSSSRLSQKKPANFAEALLELGNRQNSNHSPEVKQGEQGKVEHDWKNQLRLERHKEVINTSVFNREQEEVAEKIKEIQEELKKLAKDLAILGSEVDKAIHEAIVNPGKYHLNFFESLRRYLQQLRKKAAESKNWLAVSQQRKQAQNHYQTGVKKSGTSFMLSSERTIATQTG